MTCSRNKTNRCRTHTGYRVTLVFAGWICVLGGSLGWSDQPRETSERKVLGSRFRTCQFPMVQTDTSGNVVETETSTTRCFDENLGNGLTLTMIEIPEGEFLMGSPESEEGRSPDEGPQHKVHVQRFFMAQFEITEEQYEAMQKRHRVRWKMWESLASIRGKDTPKIATEGIAWPWAVEFCARLAKLTGKPYRLPSEAEWEYATRAGSVTAYTFGPVITPTLANCGDTHRGLAPVGNSGPANAFGLYDVHGNVGEWVSDSYHASYSGAPVDGSPWWDKDDPKGLNLHKERVMRGGAYGNLKQYCRSASRSKWPRELSASEFGFRVALSAPNE